jgi:hypothetical protein
MPYSVQVPDEQKSYLRSVTGLTREGRIKLAAGVYGNLRDHGDFFRNDPSRRSSPDSPYFHFDFIFFDNGRYWRASCFVDDSAAIYGVLKVVYLECQ